MNFAYLSDIDKKIRGNFAQIAEYCGSNVEIRKLVEEKTLSSVVEKHNAIIENHLNNNKILSVEDKFKCYGEAVIEEDFVDIEDNSSCPYTETTFDELYPQYIKRI